MGRSIGFTIAAIAMVAAISDASAALSTSQTVNSGQKTGLVAFWNCDSHVPPIVQVDTPMHGTATVVMMTGDYCEHSGEPMEAVFYQSNPGFRGMDEVTVYGPYGEVEAYYDLTVK